MLLCASQDKEMPD